MQIFCEILKQYIKKLLDYNLYIINDFFQVIRESNNIHLGAV